MSTAKWFVICILGKESKPGGDEWATVFKTLTLKKVSATSREPRRNRGGQKQHVVYSINKFLNAAIPKYKDQINHLWWHCGADVRWVKTRGAVRLQKSCEYFKATEFKERSLPLSLKHVNHSITVISKCRSGSASFHLQRSYKSALYLLYTKSRHPSLPLRPLLGKCERGIPAFGRGSKESGLGVGSERKV